MLAINRSPGMSARTRFPNTPTPIYSILDAMTAHGMVVWWYGGMVVWWERWKVRATLAPTQLTWKAIDLGRCVFGSSGRTRVYLGRRGG